MTQPQISNNELLQQSGNPGVYTTHIFLQFCIAVILLPPHHLLPLRQTRKCCPPFFLVYFFHFASIFLRSTIVLPDIQIAYFLMDMWNERMKKGRNDDTTSKEYFNYLLYSIACIFSALCDSQSWECVMLQCPL